MTDTSDRRRENMKRLNADLKFASRRDERARERFVAENDRLQRLANIAKRGCEVPEYLEDAWRDLKDKRVSNREAARMLRIPWLADPDDAAELKWRLTAAARIGDEMIDQIERLVENGRLDPDDARDIVERAKGQGRVLTWNNGGEGGK